MHGLTCSDSCQPNHIHTNLHAVWDTTLINKTVWDWGAYVDRLEENWLKSGDANTSTSGIPVQWALQSHQAAQTIWAMTPSDLKLGDEYFQKALPILDRQLGLAGIRLAHFLNQGYKSALCDIRAGSGNLDRTIGGVSA